MAIHSPIRRDAATGLQYPQNPTTVRLQHEVAHGLLAQLPSLLEPVSWESALPGGQIRQLKLFRLWWCQAAVEDSQKVQSIIKWKTIKCHTPVYRTGTFPIMRILPGRISPWQRESGIPTAESRANAALTPESFI